MNVGDRVRYVGVQRPDWHGIDATVTRDGNTFEVKFDREWSNTMLGGLTTGRHGNGILRQHLELIVKIDTSRPIRFLEPNGNGRECLNVGRIQMPGQPERILVMSTYGIGGAPWDAPMEFNLDGTPNVRSGASGAALRIENVPKVDSGFYPLDSRGAPAGRGLISLDFALSDYPETKFFLEIVREDGVPTEAKIHARPSAS